MMSGEHFEREAQYQCTMAVLRQMVAVGLITDAELWAAEQLLLSKLKPLLGSLVALAR